VQRSETLSSLNNFTIAEDHLPCFTGFEESRRRCLHYCVSLAWLSILTGFLEWSVSEVRTDHFLRWQAMSPSRTQNEFNRK